MYLYIKKNIDSFNIEDLIEYVFDVDISNDIKVKENLLINFNLFFLVVWSGEIKYIL